MSNVQVNAIAPGFIRSDMTAKLWNNSQMLDWIQERTPARRFGEPQDLIGAAIFPASAASNFVTGHVLYVDGGFAAEQTWPLDVAR